MLKKNINVSILANGSLCLKYYCLINPYKYVYIYEKDYTNFYLYKKRKANKKIEYDFLNYKDKFL